MKCRFWQIHLSTAVLMLLLGGGLLGLNLVEGISHSDELDDLVNVKAQYGWPLVANIVFYQISRREMHALKLRADFAQLPRSDHPPTTKSFWNRTAIAIDFMTLFASCIVVGFISEWFIRRREGRKT